MSKVHCWTMALAAALALAAPAWLAAAEDDNEAAYKAWRETVNRPVVRVKKVDKPPTIDGAIDEVYAKEGSPLKFSFLNGSAGKPEQATTCYIVSDASNLYIAANCECPDPKNLLCEKEERDNNVWQDECVEMFIDPNNTREDMYFHIIVNSKGVTQDAQERDDNSWDPKLEVKTGKDKKAWIMEIKIPLKELGVKADKINKIWSLNLNRSARDPDDPKTVEDTAWAPTDLKSSHVPSMFGYLWLDAGNRVNK